jgi:hypothetical protein
MVQREEYLLLWLRERKNAVTHPRDQTCLSIGGLVKEKKQHQSIQYSMGINKKGAV